MAAGSGWNEKTPPEVRDGCFVVPGALPIWNAFLRLHRRRQQYPFGGFAPLSFRDIADVSDRCFCELPAETVSLLIEQLDDRFLEWASEK